jgi:hypothetical protein
LYSRRGFSDLQGDRCLENKKAQSKKERAAGDATKDVV